MANVIRKDQFVRDLSTSSELRDITSGTYTPVEVNPSSTINLTNVTMKTHQYLQLGNIMIVGGGFTGEVLNSGSSSIKFSLPFEVETLTNLYGLHACVSTVLLLRGGGYIVASGTSANLLMVSNGFTPGNVIKFHYTFQYLVE